MFEFTTPLPDLAATEELARKLAPHVKCGEMLGLAGPLGAGKTAFARALLHALGIEGEVPSPTFTLLQTYETPRFPIYHFDLYRLKSETELDELGWDDACADGLVIAEWPERAANRLPQDRLMLNFTLDVKGGHHCMLKPYGNWIGRISTLDSA